MCLNSVGTRVGQRNVAGFAAIRAIVEAVDAEMHFVLAFADAAILLAAAKRFCLVALNADNRPARHNASTKTLPERLAAEQGKAGTSGACRSRSWPVISTIRVLLLSRGAW